MTERNVTIKKLAIGHKAPIRIESMLKEPLSSYDRVLEQCQA